MRDMQAYIDKYMENGVEKISTELMSEFSKKADSAREKELEVELGMSLNRIAIRIDRGFNFEVRMCAAEKPAEGEAPTPESLEAQQAHDRIAGAASTLQFLRLQGEPLLQLKEEPREAEGKTQ